MILRLIVGTHLKQFMFFLKIQTVGCARYLRWFDAHICRVSCKSNWNFRLTGNHFRWTDKPAVVCPPGPDISAWKEKRYSRLASTWSQNSYVQRCHQNRTQTFVLLNLTNAHPLNATHYCLYFVVGPFKTAVFAEKRACTASYLKHCSCCCWLQCFVSYSPLSATPQVKIISQNASLYFCFSWQQPRNGICSSYSTFASNNSLVLAQEGCLANLSRLCHNARTKWTLK